MIIIGEIRIGTVSSIDYEHGMVSVLYEDLEECVTDDMPYLTMNGEYRMPPIGSMVLVMHLSNGMSMGIVAGTFWNMGNMPAESGKGIYRKELGGTPGEAFMRYTPDGKLLIKAPEIILETEQGEVQFKICQNGGE